MVYTNKTKFPIKPIDLDAKTGFMTNNTTSQSIVEPIL